MSERLINSYQKLLGKIISISTEIDINGKWEIEYVQGVLKEVREDMIVIEQYLSLYDYVQKKNPPSVLRGFKYGDFKNLFNFQH